VNENVIGTIIVKQVLLIKCLSVLVSGHLARGRNL